MKRPKLKHILIKSLFPQNESYKVFVSDVIDCYI